MVIANIGQSINNSVLCEVWSNCVEKYAVSASRIAKMCLYTGGRSQDCMFIKTQCMVVLNLKA